LAGFVFVTVAMKRVLLRCFFVGAAVNGDAGYPPEPDNTQPTCGGKVLLRGHPSSQVPRLEQSNKSTWPLNRPCPVILFAPSGVMLPGVKNLIERLRELKADTLAITSDLDAAALCSRSIIMPREIDEFLAPIPYIVPGQLFAALLAEAKGLDPDAPRSLSKVTRTL